VTFDKNAKFSAYGGFLTHDYNTKTTQVHNWNLSIQQQITRDWLVSASYIGNESAHLWTTRALNPADPIDGTSSTSQLSAIWRVQSGAFLTIGPGIDRSLDGTSAGSQRVNQVLPNPYGDKDSLNSYLNPKAFEQPALGTIGRMGRANILGPGFWTLDIAVSRAFPLGEAKRAEVRAEAFNTTNSLRRNNPVTNLNSNQFGQITSGADRRIMQFVLKYAF
jgi:hypothetical protein